MRHVAVGRFWVLFNVLARLERSVDDGKRWELISACCDYAGPEGWLDGIESAHGKRCRGPLIRRGRTCTFMRTCAGSGARVLRTSKDAHALVCQTRQWPAPEVVQ
jgi:hypothetical protein